MKTLLSDIRSMADPDVNRAFAEAFDTLVLKMNVNASAKGFSQRDFNKVMKYRALIKELRSAKV